MEETLFQEQVKTGSELNKELASVVTVFNLSVEQSMFMFSHTAARVCAVSGVPKEAAMSLFSQSYDLAVEEVELFKSPKGKSFLSSVLKQLEGILKNNG